MPFIAESPLLDCFRTPTDRVLRKRVVVTEMKSIERTLGSDKTTYHHDPQAFNNALIRIPEDAKEPQIDRVLRALVRHKKLAPLTFASSLECHLAHGAHGFPTSQLQKHRRTVDLAIQRYGKARKSVKKLELVERFILKHRETNKDASLFTADHLRLVQTRLGENRGKATADCAGGHGDCAGGLCGICGPCGPCGPLG